MAAPIPFHAREPWKYFFSLRIGIFILILLTIASVIGTLIDPLERAQQVVYYTWWFKALLLALSVNMACATGLNVVQRILPQRHPQFQKSAGFYKAVKSSAIVTYQGDAETVAKAFRAKGFKTFVEGNFGFARRGFLSRWGAPISHVGLIAVLLGGFASSFVAKEGIIQLFEGGSTDQLTLLAPGGKSTGEKLDLGFTVRVEDFDTDFFPQTRIPSHYVSTVTFLRGDEVLASDQVEVNSSPIVDGWKFHQTSYQTYDQYRRYTLSVEHASLAEPVLVELSAGQSRPIPGLEGRQIGLHAGTPLHWVITQEGEVVQQAALGGGTSSGRLTITAEQFEPDFILGPDRQAASRSQELNNPALKVTLRDGQQVLTSQWLFGRADMRAFSHNEGGPYGLELSDVHREGGGWHFNVAITDSETGLALGTAHFGVGESRVLQVGPAVQEGEKTTAGEWTVSLAETGPLYATVLSVTRNPSIPPIYVGCTLMMIGLMVAFFIRRKDVWFMVDPRSSELRVAGVYRHSREDLDPQTMAIVQQFSTSPKN